MDRAATPHGHDRAGNRVPICGVRARLHDDGHCQSCAVDGLTCVHFEGHPHEEFPGVRGSGFEACGGEHPGGSGEPSAQRPHERCRPSERGVTAFGVAPALDGVCLSCSLERRFRIQVTTRGIARCRRPGRSFSAVFPPSGIHLQRSNSATRMDTDGRSSRPTHPISGSPAARHRVRGSPSLSPAGNSRLHTQRRLESTQVHPEWTTSSSG